ncbi:M16 family metallopeptidase [Motilimonas sp. KMU-193]|uniref:M16 family metallopeptidase n=1 Tax=Motilimonas sp. KMU-193 TaxID=3388668 RepID=UPI00396AF9F9
MRLYHSLCFALIALLYSLPTLATPLKPDPNWQIHQLDNGFQYRLYSVDETSDRVQIYLWVKSGSIDETQEQKGGAHLLEHMAFNGTKHFPGHKIEQLFKQAGLNFGQDLNAFTNYKDTVYTLSIPENNQELLNEVLLYLSDVAQSITLDETEVAKEIGVVQGEYYTRAGNELEPDIAYMQAMSTGSQYGYYGVIGTLEQIERLNAKALQDYYHAWYRPDNMELLVVGNIDKQQVATAIEKQFKRLYGKAQSKNRPAEPEFKHATQTFQSEKVMRNNISLNYILPKAIVQTVADSERNSLIHFTHALINMRLARAHELSQNPFAGVNSYIGQPLFVGDNWLYSLGIDYELSQDHAAIDWLGAEIAKINQFGFSQAEFDQLEQMYFAHLFNFEQTYQNRTSQVIINEYLHAQQQQQVSVDKATTLSLFEGFLDQLTLAKVNQFAKQTLVNPQIYQIAPSADTTSPLNAGAIKPHQQLETWVAAALKQTVTPYPSEQLVANYTRSQEQGQTGKLIAEQSHKALGIEQLTYANGLSVLLQPDNTNKGMVYFQFSALGGITTLDANYRAAATMLIDAQVASGLENQSAQQVSQALASHITTINPFINNTQRGFDGSMPTNQLEFGLDYLSRAYRSTKVDEAAFKQVKTNFSSNVKNYINSKQGQVDSRYFQTLYGNNPYEGLLSLTQIQQTTPADIQYVKQQLFGSAADFKLTLVGDFEPEQAKQLINQYLATLPKGEKHAAQKVQLNALESKASLNERLNENDRADLVFQFVYQGVEPSVKQIYAADLLARLLQDQLMTTVREELSLAYSPYAGCDPAIVNLNYSHCRIALITAPKDATKAKQAIEKILTNFYQNGADETALAQHKKVLETAMLDTFKDPQSRAWFIHRDWVLGYDVGSVLEADAILASIDKPYIDGLIKQMLQQAGQVTLINTP